jgi:hypothetical protein
MRPCDLRRSAIKLLSQRIFSASRRILDLKNAANGSGKDDKRDRCRQRRAILAHQFTRIRFSVHMAMESGRRRRCEQDARTFELCAALSLAKLYQSNNRGATPPRWRLALSIIKTSCSSLDEAMLVASNFNVLAAKIRSKQECAFRRNTQQALPPALSLDVIRSIAQLPTVRGA